MARSLIRGLEEGGAGGHEATAGGRVFSSPDKRDEIKGKLRERFLKRLGCDISKGIPFV